MSALFPHQVEGIDYLVDRKRAYIADPPGFGKTRIAVEAAARLGLFPIVVCPAIVRTHWEREFKRWAPYGMKPLVFSYDAIVNGGYELMYELLRTRQFKARVYLSAVSEMLPDASPDYKIDVTEPNLLILDEAHYLKNPTSQRTKLLLGANGYARRMDYVWAMSGTPTPKNNPMEYWTVLSCMFPEAALAHGLRNSSQFSEHFCITTTRVYHGKTVRKVVGVKNVPELNQLMGGTMLRRSASELSFKMPPVFRQFLPVDLREHVEEPDLSDQDGVTYSELVTDVLSDSDLSRYRHNVGDAKVDLVLEMLTEQLSGTTDKVVVFAHHRSVLEALKFGLEQFGVAYIDGDTTQNRRAVMIDNFQNNPATRVFLGQTIACHTGITLTAASRVILVEPDWTDAVNKQAAHRVARIGQVAETCIVQYIVAADTLDEGIIRSLAREEWHGELLYGTEG